MDSCWVNGYSMGDDLPRCWTVSQGAEPEMAVANVVRQETFDALTLSVEPRTAMLYLKTLRVGRIALCCPDIRFNALTNAGKLTKLRIRFGGMRSADMQIFRPFRFLWSPVEAEVNVTPRWVIDALVEGRTGRLCHWAEARISGSMRWTTDLLASVSRGEGAAMDLSSVPLWAIDGWASGHFARSLADVDGTAQTVREIPVSIHPRGGVSYVWMEYSPWWNLWAPVEGKSVGDGTLSLSVSPRRTDVTDVEVVVEVRG
nr:hypothetical protein [uncultured Dethiosulfovibrio sp.]